ncbi:MAG TPA: M1 family aminopeptidase [Polyangium sp.]|nr:M1 family aminopeptidase [Polyangium sp.]
MHLPASTIVSVLALGCSFGLLACGDDKPSACPNNPSCSNGSSSSSGGGPEGDLLANVTKYDYKFDIESATGTTHLDLDVAPPGGNCWDVSCERENVSSVMWNDGAATSAAVSNGKLRACGPGVTEGPTLTVGGDVTLAQELWFGLDVGFSRRKNMAGGTFTYLLSWVGGCDRFGPCDDDPSRMAAFHFEVTHPQDTVVLCPGTRTAGATTTTCDVQNAPTYSAFAIAADTSWVAAPFGKFAGGDFVFYEVPGGGIAASLEKPSVGAFMDWITGLLGPFPYGQELRLAGARTAWLGFEHPANIVLLEKLDTLHDPMPNTSMHVVMHEIIHQWAGDRSTLATATDFVWKEATAEYLAYVFEDENRPAQEAIATRKYWDDISPQASYWPKPMDMPPPDVQSFYGDVYGPGPMVLYLQLEPLIGRPAVLQGIKTFLATAGGRSVDELKQALASASGKNLDAYFDAWVFGQGKPEWPTFDIKTNQVGADVTITVTQQNASGKLYGCVVEVELRGATSSTRALIDFGVAPSQASATASATLNEPVTSVILDPDNRLIGRKAGAPPIMVKRPVLIF